VPRVQYAKHCTIFFWHCCMLHNHCACTNIAEYSMQLCNVHAFNLTTPFLTTDGCNILLSFGIRISCPEPPDAFLDVDPAMWESRKQAVATPFHCKLIQEYGSLMTKTSHYLSSYCKLLSSSGSKKHIGWSHRITQKFDAFLGHCMLVHSKLFVSIHRKIKIMQTGFKEMMHFRQ